MSHFLSPVFAPGFFTSGPVATALALGVVVAGVSGCVGVFAVIRGQAFAAEALSDIGAAGGSAAFLVAVGPLWGFLASGAGAAAVMELIGVQRPRGRDLAAGIVLGGSLGLAALFLYLDSTRSGASGATVSVLFGSLFALDSSLLPAVASLAGLAVGIVCVVARPLLLSSLHPDLAAVRGVPVRLVGALYLLALSLSVALSSLTIGAILGTSLLIGPAATALRLTGDAVRAMLLAGLLGTVAVVVGVVLAYDSYLWPPHGRGWPVSFFVVGSVLVMYLSAGLWERAQRHGGSRRVRTSRRG